MEKVVVKAVKRSVIGKKVGALRREGNIPGVVYGHHIEPISILMNRREVTRAIAGLTSSSIITVDIDGEKHAALIREKQRNYLRDELIHIDFQAVSLKEKIRSKIQITLTGSAPAVKNFDGMVLQDKEFIEVEALPNDLPERINVDISNLQKIGDLIRVSDLTISDKVTVFDDGNETIVTISGVASDMAEEETVAAEGSEPEVVEKGKKEKIEE
jgi:large subunit ribosomal protein L25